MQKALLAAIALNLIAALGAVVRAQPSWWGDHDPVADPAAVVTVGQARFTVLTSMHKIIRLELSNATPPTFNDAATLVVINRRLTVPKFTARENRHFPHTADGRLEAAVRRKQAGAAAATFHARVAQHHFPI